MGSLYLTARHLGRSSTAYVSLCAAGLFLTAINPTSLWDVSFQLTFAASLGLALLAQPLEGFLEKSLSKWIAYDQLRAVGLRLGELLAVTLAPQVAVLPIVAFGFGRLSVVAPLANLLIAPAQPLIMTWGGGAMLLGLVRWLLPLARVLAWLPWLLLAYTRAVVHWMSAWPLATIPVGPTASAWLAVGLCACLAILWLTRHRQAAARPLSAWLTENIPGRVGIGLTLIALALLSLTISQLPDRRLHVDFLDVGQGDAIFITTPRGQQILVDGGPSPMALLTSLGKEMPFWDHSIDLVVSTHADSDHLTGLVYILQRYEVGGWIDSGLSGDDPLARECLEVLAQARVQRRVAVAGDQLDLGEGVFLLVMNPQRNMPPQTPTDSNNNSVVLRLRDGRISFLLTGDIEAETEHLLLRSDELLHTDVLKVAHHGSAGSSTSEFLTAVGPSFAVISVGAENRSGLPAGETLERLTLMGDLVVLRTDERGTIEFTSDGQQLWMHAER
jgi:competence protein ComEC